MFYFPEKPNLITESAVGSAVPPHYLVQVKKDGWRVLIEADKKGKITLYNRYGKELSETAQKRDWSWLAETYPFPFFLDGELVGMRQKGDDPDTIVIWDAAKLKGKLLINRPYLERYEMLKEGCGEFPSGFEKGFGTNLIAHRNNGYFALSNNYLRNDWSSLLQKLVKDYDEGLVFKNPNSPLSWRVDKSINTSNQIKLIK